MKIEFDKKRLLFPSILLVCALGIYLSDFIFPPKEMPVSAVTTNTSVNNLPPVNPVKNVKPVNQVGVIDELDKIPSPFSVIPVNAGTVSRPEMNPSQMGPIPKITGAVPPINMSGIHPPGSGIPNYGNIKANLGEMKSISIIVKAILQGQDGSNMAVLGNGTSELIVYEGQNSDWGYVSAIKERSVVLNEKTLLLPK